MKTELDYFWIEGSLGGNQNWLWDPMMKGGGCAAVTACDICIYLKRQRGMDGLYPYDAEHLTKKDFIHFTGKMKPYLHPRWQGIDTLDIYLSGIRSYWRDVGCTGLSADGFPGTGVFREAQEIIRRQIDQGFPVPYLLLKHRDPSFEDYVWHWFNLAGYEELDDTFYVKTVTYGAARWMNLQELWDTGFAKKGGLILLSES